MAKVSGITLLVLLAVGAGLWFAWRAGFVGAPPLPGPLGPLEAHLRTQGLDARGQLVQRGASAGVRQHAMFRVAGTPERVFFVLWCDSPATAQQHLARLRSAPSPSLPHANGTLVVYLTDWPADDPLTRRVLAAFAGFGAESG